MKIVKSEAVRFNPKISAAIRNRDLPALRGLLMAEPQQLGAFTPFAGGTWLHYAAGEGNIEAVRYLMSQGIDVNTGDWREGRAPLCDACFGGHEEIARLLIDAGSILDTSESVRNPLFSAIVGRSLPIAKMLLDHGIDPTISYSGPSMTNMSAVAFALERGETAIAQEIARRIAGSDDKEAISRILNSARHVVELNNKSSP